MRGLTLHTGVHTNTRTRTFTPFGLIGYSFSDYLRLLIQVFSFFEPSTQLSGHNCRFFVSTELQHLCALLSNTLNNHLTCAFRISLEQELN